MTGEKASSLEILANDEFLRELKFRMFGDTVLWTRVRLTSESIVGVHVGDLIRRDLEPGKLIFQQTHQVWGKNADGSIELDPNLVFVAGEEVIIGCPGGPGHE